MNKIIDFIKSLFGSSGSANSISKTIAGSVGSMATGIATGIVMKKVTDKMMEGELNKAKAQQAEAMKAAGMTPSGQNLPK
jgi:hypothetical protein